MGATILGLMVESSAQKENEISVGSKKNLTLQKLRGKKYFSYILIAFPFFMLALAIVLYGVYLERGDTTYCHLSRRNLCDKEYVELQGKIKDPTLHSGLGYKFIPERTNIPNPIYIKALRFTGREISFDGNTVGIEHSILFGSRIVVRGNVNVSDKGRCSDRSYALGNPDVCDEDKFRVLVSPDAVVSVPDLFEKRTRYSLYGKFVNISMLMKSCPAVATFCEGHRDDSCYSINLESRACQHIKETPNMFLVTGYGEKPLKRITPNEIYQISGVSYSSKPIDKKAAQLLDRYHTDGDPGKFSVYNELGERISVIDTEKTLYYDLSQVIPTKEGVYYFVDNKLYFQKLGEQESVLLGAIDEELLPEGHTIYSKRISDDGNELIFMVSKFLGSEPFDPYLLKTYRYYILKLQLDELSLSRQHLIPEVLYEEEVVGSMSLLGYDFETDEALIYYRFDREQKDACRRQYYTLVDTHNSRKTDIVAYATSGNMSCSKAIHKELFISSNGKTLVFGEDFNVTLGTDRPNKLVVYEVVGTDVRKRVYLSSPELLQKASFQIIDKVGDKLFVVNPWDIDLLYAFDLDLTEYTYSNLEPISQVDSALESTSSLSTFGVSLTPWYTYGFNYNHRYFFRDQDRLYFFGRDVSESKLYTINKKSKELFLVGDFSVFAKPLVVQDKLFIVDIYY